MLKADWIECWSAFSFASQRRLTASERLSLDKVWSVFIAPSATFKHESSREAVRADWEERVKQSKVEKDSRVIITYVFGLFGFIILLSVIICSAGWLGRFIPKPLTAILMLIASFCSTSNPFAFVFLLWGLWALMARYNEKHLND